MLSVIPSLVNGAPVVSSVRIPVLSSGGKLLHHYLPLPSSVSLDQVARNAFVGFQKWSARPALERADVLRAAALTIGAKHDFYVERHMELGAPRGFADVCARAAANSFLELALALVRAEGCVAQLHVAPLALALRTPVGPVLSLAPWNAPTVLWARALAAPLAAGCLVVAKGTEKAPLLAYFYAQDLLAAGVDKEAVQLVHVLPENQRSATEALIARPEIRKVNFTGSTEVGAQVAAAAAQSLTPVLLELGGKNVSVVCQDAHIDRAAFLAVLSAWMHQGQICMCLDNVYVHEAVYDDFLARVAFHAQKLALLPDAAIPFHNADKVRRMVDEALSGGARVVWGDAKRFPLVLADVPPQSALATRETFGPVLSIFRFSDAEDVLSRINALSYGLKASVWSSNVMEALAMARRLDFGSVHINGSTVHDEGLLPHGGVKSSGYGRFNGMWGIDEFSYTKVVTMSS